MKFKILYLIMIFMSMNIVFASSVKKRFKHKNDVFYKNNMTITYLDVKCKTETIKKVKINEIGTIYYFTNDYGVYLKDIQNNKNYILFDGKNVLINLKGVGDQKELHRHDYKKYLEYFKNNQCDKIAFYNSNGLYYPNIFNIHSIYNGNRLSYSKNKILDLEIHLKNKLEITNLNMKIMLADNYVPIFTNKIDKKIYTKKLILTVNKSSVIYYPAYKDGKIIENKVTVDKKILKYPINFEISFYIDDIKYILTRNKVCYSNDYEQYKNKYAFIPCEPLNEDFPYKDNKKVIDEMLNVSLQILNILNLKETSDISKYIHDSRNILIYRSGVSDPEEYKYKNYCWNKKDFLKNYYSFASNENSGCNFARYLPVTSYTTNAVYFHTHTGMDNSMVLENVKFFKENKKLYIKSISIYYDTY